MTYVEYCKEYFNRIRHKPMDSKKKWLLLNILSKQPFLSAYYYRLLEKVMKLPKKAKILDVGCAQGSFLNFLKNLRQDFELHGMDISDVKKMLPAKVNFIKGDIIRGEIPKKKFDFVVSRHLLEHLKVEDAPRFFQQCKTMLKLGGICFVLTPRLSNEFFNDPTHIRPYNKTSLERLFKQTGFINIDCFDGYEFRLPIRWVRKDMKMAFGFAQKPRQKTKP